MPRIIRAIISVQPTAMTRKAGLAAPVATRTPAIQHRDAAGDHHPAVTAVASGLSWAGGAGGGIALGCHRELRSDFGR
jgi:hypothetical protein